VLLASYKKNKKNEEVSKTYRLIDIFVLKKLFRK